MAQGFQVPPRDPRLLQTKKALRDIAREWDEIAEIRFQQYLSGQDRNYVEILKPAILTAARSYSDGGRALDVGCGLGDIAFEYAKTSGQPVDAVDISAKNISIANRHFTTTGVAFFCDAAESFYQPNMYKLVIASMFLMDVENLVEHVRGINRCLRPGGIAVATIPHPCFWPIRRKYADRDWYDYLKEMPVDGPYSFTTDALRNFYTTHFLRPMSAYMNAFSETQLQTIEVQELTGPDEQGQQPKFMLFALRKSRA